MEKSVFTKRGPDTGARGASPSSPRSSGADCGGDKSARIEPILQRVNPRRSVASRVGRNRAGLVWISDLVRAVQDVSVPHEVDAGAIVAVHHKQRKTSGRLLDHVDLPVTENAIHRTAPVTPETLAFTERKIVQHAGGELLGQIELRKAPIGLLTAGQRPVCRPGEGSEAIGQSRVVGVGPGIAEKRIDAVARALGFRLDLERIIAGAADIVVIVNGCEGTVRRGESRSPGTATQRVTCNHTAGRGRSNVLIHPVHQDVRAARTCVSNRENHVFRQLMFHIQIELLHHALLEIKILRLDGSRETRRIRRRGEQGQESGLNSAARGSE